MAMVEHKAPRHTDSVFLMKVCLYIDIPSSKMKLSIESLLLHGMVMLIQKRSPGCSTNKIKMVTCKNSFQGMI